MFKYTDLDELAIKKLAQKLAMELKGRSALVGLIGPLGAGKTTFAKAFGKSFHITHMSSPTFVISHEYRIPQGKFYHLDFYRLQDSKHLIPLGIPDMLRGKNIVLAEWVDRFPQIKRKCDILINFRVLKDNKRDVTIEIPNDK